MAILIGCNTNYWTEFIQQYQSRYGLDKAGAINRFTDYCKQGGFKHVRQQFITSLQTIDWLKMRADSCHAKGLTFSLQSDCRLSPWNEGSMPMDEQKVRAILNVNGEGNAMRADEIQAANYYQLDAIGIFNEPHNWNTYISHYNEGRAPWFANYIGMSDETDFYEKYVAWITATVSALRAARSMRIIVDPIPFWDANKLMNDSRRPSGSDIAYSVHLYYRLYGGYPPSWEQWARDYWDGNLTAARTELYSYLESYLHGPVVRAGCRPYQEELGTDSLRPNWQAFMKDIMNYNVDRNYDFNVHSMTDYGQWQNPSAPNYGDPSGMLITDTWEPWSEYGQYVVNYIANLQPPLGIDFNFSKTYQGGPVNLILT